jgi:hypothetical protein
VYKDTERCKSVCGCIVHTAFSINFYVECEQVSKGNVVEGSNVNVKQNQIVSAYGIHHKAYAGALDFIRSDPDDSMTPINPNDPSIQSTNCLEPDFARAKASAECLLPPGRRVVVVEESRKCRDPRGGMHRRIAQKEEPRVVSV